MKKYKVDYLTLKDSAYEKCEKVEEWLNAQAETGYKLHSAIILQEEKSAASMLHLKNIMLILERDEPVNQETVLSYRKSF